MVKSKIYQGLVYAGTTQLASSITVEQTGPMQLTIGPGIFTTTGGVNLEFPVAEVVELTPLVWDVEVAILLGVIDGRPGLLLRQNIEGFAEAEIPDNFNFESYLVLPFTIPANSTELPDIYVLSVLPGFPPGTGPNDWKMQTGMI